MLARCSPAAYAMATTSSDARPWKPAKFHLEINRALVDVEQGRTKRLVVSIPPQHGKTTLVVENFVPWYMGEHPDHKIQIGSYAASLAASWSRKARNKFAEWAPVIHGVTLSSEKATATEWAMAGHAGEVFAAGVDGGQTGRGAQGVIVDDPLKNYAEAQSELIREKTWDWFASSIVTRLSADGWVIIIMTRWHEDDLAGRAMAQWTREGIPFVELRIPGIAEEDDPLGRPIGTPLWPESGRTLAWYEQQKREIGPTMFDCLYQQAPSRVKGSIFQRKWFQYFKINGKHLIHGGSYTEMSLCRRFGIMDLAHSSKTLSAFTVMASFARGPHGDLFWLDVDRDRYPTDEHLGRVIIAIRLFKLAYVGIEDNGYQTSLITSAIKAGLPVVPVHADKDKVTRSLPLQAMYANRRVWHLEGAPWLDALEKELLSFPAGTYKDQVDVGAYAAISIVEMAATPGGVYLPT